MWTLKNESIYKTETDSHRIQIYSYQRGKEINWDQEIKSIHIIWGLTYPLIYKTDEQEGPTV